MRDDLVHLSTDLRENHDSKQLEHNQHAHFYHRFGAVISVADGRSCGDDEVHGGDVDGGLVEGFGEEDVHFVGVDLFLVPAVDAPIILLINPNIDPNTRANMEKEYECDILPEDCHSVLEDVLFLVLEEGLEEDGELVESSGELEKAEEFE